MNYDIIAAARTRVEAARFRKTPDFERHVQEALREALSQPFGEPLDVARVHSRSNVPHRRAVWQAVVAELERNPALRAQRPVPSKAAVDMEAAADRRRYRVGLLTDVGPGTPGGVLNGLAIEGVASVTMRRDDAGEPSLLYLVPVDCASDSLEELRDESVSYPVAAE